MLYRFRIRVRLQQTVQGANKQPHRELSPNAACIADPVIPGVGIHQNAGSHTTQARQNTNCLCDLFVFRLYLICFRVKALHGQQQDRWQHGAAPPKQQASKIPIVQSNPCGSGKIQYAIQLIMVKCLMLHLNYQPCFRGNLSCSSASALR